MVERMQKLTSFRAGRVWSGESYLHWEAYGIILIKNRVGKVPKKVQFDRAIE